MNISAIIIAKNEEKNIAGCVKSLNFVDEITVIDNISTDNTIDVAGKLKAKIYQFSGLDFSAMRNFGKDKARGDWLLYIDADERVTKQLAQEITAVIKKSNHSAYQVTRQNFYFGKPWPHQEKMIRLIKKDALLGWFGQIHETAKVAGSIGILKNPLNHYTHNNLGQMVDKTNSWSEIEAQLRYQSHHPPVVCWRILRVTATTFWDSYIKKQGFLVGRIGLLESFYQSFSMFITYAKLWEMQNQKKS